MSGDTLEDQIKKEITGAELAVAPTEDKMREIA